MRDQRIVIETQCDHGNYFLNCQTLLCVNYNHIHSIADGCFCHGGEVRRFTAEEFYTESLCVNHWGQLVSKQRRFDEPYCREQYRQGGPCDVRLFRLVPAESSLFDALSDHTEGTP